MLYKYKTYDVVQIQDVEIVAAGGEVELLDLTDSAVGLVIADLSDLREVLAPVVLRHSRRTGRG